MFRLALASVVCVAFFATGVASAADYYDDLPTDFRKGFDSLDMNDAADPLDFEFGARYFYSQSAHQLVVANGAYNANDAAHVLELHGRIEDHSTSTYVKAIAGHSLALSNTYSTPQFTGDVNSTAGRIAYVGADFGYLGIGNEDFGFGGFVGYKYLNESADMGRAVYQSAAGGDSSVNDLNYNMLRLGLAAKANLGSMFDITVEAAAIPYAHLSGTYGAFYVPPSGTLVQGSAGNISGNLWGGSAEVMVGFHPTDNLTIRGGGRAWYLTGPTTMNFDVYDTGAGTTTSYIANSTNFSSLRVGALAELTYSF